MPRIAIAQIRPVKADYDENLKRIGRALAEVARWEHPPDLVVFPETMTTGYFLEGGIREGAVTAGRLWSDLEALVTPDGPPVDVAVGFYEEYRNGFFNSAMYATLRGSPRGIRHVHRKVFLPTYGLFDEARFVGQGHSIRAFDTGFGRVAMIVCEDAWHSLVPAIAALDGAQLIMVLSASPARGAVLDADENGVRRPLSAARWLRVLRNISEEHGVFTACAQLVGFEGGKGFTGGSCVIGPGGALLAEAPFFEDAIVPVDIDWRDITRARADSPLLSDLEAEVPHLVDNLLDPARDPAAWDPAPVVRRAPRSTPPVGARDPLAIDSELLASWLTVFLADEVRARRGFNRGVVAVSGGVDSAVTVALAVRALGKENVTGFWLPGPTSSSESHAHAVLVAETFGIELRTIDISGAVAAYVAALGEAPDANRLGNVMARLRMIALFDQSAALRALPLGTGNKSERLLGYFTWHADDSPPVNPLGDLFKSQVWDLARYLGVPLEIVDKPATADLVRGQTDEADLGISYPRADRILHWLLSGFGDDELGAMGFAAEELAVVQRRLESTHWKRRLPTVATVSQTAIGEYYLRPVDY